MLLLFLLFTLTTFASTIDESARWSLQLCLELRKFLYIPEALFSPLLFYTIREQLDTRRVQTPNPLWNQCLKTWIVAEQRQLNYYFVMKYWRILDNQITHFSKGVLKWVPLDEIDHTIVPYISPLFIPTGLAKFYTDDSKPALYRPLVNNEKIILNLFSGNYDAFLSAHYWSIFTYWLSPNSHLFPFKVRRLFSLKEKNCSLREKISALEGCWDDFWTLDHCKSPLLIHTLAHYLAYLRHYTIVIQASSEIYIKVINLWQLFQERLHSFCEEASNSIQLLFEVPVGKVLPLGLNQQKCYVSKCKVFGVPWDGLKPYKPQTTLKYTEAGQESYVSIFTSVHAKTNKCTLQRKITKFLQNDDGRISELVLINRS